MISPSPLSPPATPSHPPSPCPYHRPGQDCEKREDCPIARYVPAAKCEALTATGIKIVQEWVGA